MGQENEVCKNGYSVVPMGMVAVTVLCDREVPPCRGLSLALTA